MFYDQWYVILESKELKRSHPLKLKRLNEDIVLWRDEDGKACSIADRCCHRGASISQGKICHGNIECPFHGFIYDKTGKVLRIPANGKNAKVAGTMKVKSYVIHEEYGLIWIWYGDNEKMKSSPFFFKELKDFPYSGFKGNWGVHYSRAIENQLDVAHLPFVHKTTIGRGNKTLVNGPAVILDKELMTFYVNNVVDDGKIKPLEPDEIKDYQQLFHLQYHFPNIWQNFISD